MQAKSCQERACGKTSPQRAGPVGRGSHTPRVPSPLYLLVGVVSYPVVMWPFRLRAYGKENLPREGGFVLAANHMSNFDPWALGMPLWPRRQLRFMAKIELFRSPLWPILKGTGAFRVRRGERDE